MAVAASLFYAKGSGGRTPAGTSPAVSWPPKFDTPPLIFTDNGKGFADRLFASRARVPTGEHAFDQLCAELGIEHRLTKPRTPQTNDMVERFNGRISDVLQSHHFVSGEDLAQTLYRYVLPYNQQLPQSTLGSKTPLDAMKRWYVRTTRICL